MEFCCPCSCASRARKSRTAGLVDPSRRNQLVDELLNILSRQPRQSDRRNVVHVERVGDVNADVARQLVADLKDAHIEHHLRTAIIQLFEQLRAGIEGSRWSAELDRIGSLAGIYVAQVEHITQSRYQFGGFLRRRMRRQNKCAQRHAVHLPVVLHVVLGEQELARRHRHPHRLAHVAGQLQSGEEAHVVDVERYLPPLDRVVKLHRHAEGGRQLREESTDVSAEMECRFAVGRSRWISVDSERLQGRLSTEGGHDRRRLAGSLREPLVRELVFRIEIESRAEFARSPQARIFRHQRVAALNVVENQLGLQSFPRCQEIDILGNQPWASSNCANASSSVWLLSSLMPRSYAARACLRSRLVGMQLIPPISPLEQDIGGAGRSVICEGEPRDCDDTRPASRPRCMLAPHED